jgi:hypothetical protein
MQLPSFVFSIAAGRTRPPPAVRIILEGSLRLLGVQLDDEVLLDGKIDVLPLGHLLDLDLEPRSSACRSPATWGRVTRDRVGLQGALELGGERLPSFTSMTSPGFTRYEGMLTFLPLTVKWP